MLVGSCLLSLHTREVTLSKVRTWMTPSNTINTMSTWQGSTAEASIGRATPWTHQWKYPSEVPLVFKSDSVTSAHRKASTRIDAQQVNLLRGIDPQSEMDQLHPRTYQLGSQNETNQTTTSLVVTNRIGETSLLLTDHVLTSHARIGPRRQAHRWKDPIMVSHTETHRANTMHHISTSQR